LGVDKVLQQFAALDVADIWIANTDADSAPHPDWIAQQLALARQGYCGVAGIVHVASIDVHRADVIARWRSEYSGAHTARIADGLDVGAVWAGRAAEGVDGVASGFGLDVTHPHVHGANLGIRADAYLDAGGWSDLALAEDHCLWGRVRACGWRVASSVACVVTTSGRLNGRAQGGFADTLRKMVLVCA
jgi:cellulose synthase/poly-beta-1,6-N-acetylglucosamine synthase-like glycosyltransferase